MLDIRVSRIGEFIRFQSCERRFKLELNNCHLARSEPFAERLFNELDPVLQELGRKAEDQWEKSLKSRGFHDLTRVSERKTEESATSWANFRELLQGLPANVCRVRKPSAGSRRRRGWRLPRPGPVLPGARRLPGRNLLPPRGTSGSRANSSLPGCAAASCLP